jgi:hypothetical protein
VKLLLDQGADCEAKDTWTGRTSLHWPAEKVHEAVVKLLLDHGVDFEVKDKYGRTRCPLRRKDPKGLFDVRNDSDTLFAYFSVVSIRDRGCSIYR